MNLINIKTLDNGSINLNSIPNGALPPEIATAFQNLLEVQGRIKFPLKPTSTSSISSSALDPISDNADAEKEVEELVNHVAEMEDLVEQLEDMQDQLTKDMNIPPPNTSIARAVQRLGGDQNITQAVFNNALSIIDYSSLIHQGQEGFTLALTGDGHINGPWLKCSQVTESAANFFTFNKSAPIIPDSVVKDKNTEIAKDFEQNLLAMVLHILLMLWWNMIWPKFMVDLAIIDPLKLMIANPLDGLIGFFIKPIFKKKSEEWIKKNGKINIALTKFRIFLLCKVPHKLWSTADKDYDPIVEINCPPNESYDCPEDSTPYDKSTGVASSSKSKSKGNAEEVAIGIDEQSSQGPCGSPPEFGSSANTDGPKTLGMSPNCLNAAVAIVNAVEGVSYTPRSASPADPTLQTSLGSQIKDNFTL